MFGNSLLIKLLRTVYCLRLVFFALAVVFVLAQTVSAAMHPGFRSLGLWDEEKKIRLDLSVWFPVNAPPAQARYEDWSLHVNRRAKPLTGLFPLIIISHDSYGNRFAYHHLAEHLTRMGFIVAAPTHQHDNDKNMSCLFTACQIEERLKELEYAIEAICTNSEIGPQVDKKRIGLIGFGAGGTAAVIFSGASVSKNAWEEWKKNAKASSPYMKASNRNRLDSIVKSEILLKPGTKSIFQCAAVIAPTHSMFFDAVSLSSVNIPVLLIAAEKDQINPKPDYLNKLAELFPEKPHMIMIKEASPLDFMAIPANNANFLPGYDPSKSDIYEDTTEQLTDAVSEFFIENLKERKD